MKPIKLLLLGMALIAVTLITTGKSFGSPGVHKESVKFEVFTTSTVTNVITDYSFLQMGEINFNPDGSIFELAHALRPMEGFLPILDSYRSDHYQARIFPPLIDERNCPRLKLNPDNPVQRI